MGIILVVLAFALFLAGIIGAVLPVLPGPPLSFLGLLLMWFSGYADFSAAFLLIWATITVIVTVMDYLLPAWMTKRFGGSRLAVIGSFVGLIAGIFFFPPFGMIVGPFLGALVGELVHNRKSHGKALKAAFGAFLAFIVGTGAKLIVGAIMLFYAVIAMF